MKRQYYSQRKNGNSITLRLNRQEFYTHFLNVFERFNERQTFGNLYFEINGEYELFFMEKLNKRPLLPFNKFSYYSKEDLFDLIEILFEYIGSGEVVLQRYNLSVEEIDEIYNDNQKANKTNFRNEVNRILSKYEEGYSLTSDGEIWDGVTDGLDDLVSNQIEIIESDSTDENNADEVEVAKSLFLHHSATETDKRNALITLGRVLEENRNEIKQMFLSKDESDLFELLNRYNIRHSDLSQKKDYPNEIFFDWMFYNLLSAIDAFYKIRNRNKIEQS